MLIVKLSKNILLFVFLIINTGLQASNSELILKYSKEDADFLTYSNDLLTMIHKHYDTIIAKDLDALINFLDLNDPYSNGESLRSCVTKYLIILSQLLKYQPNHDGPEFKACHKQLLKTQQDLEELSTYSKTDYALYKQAIIIIKELRLRHNIPNLNNFDITKFKPCKCDTYDNPKPKYKLVYFITEIQTYYRRTLQTMLDKYLQDNKQHVTPKLVKWLMERLDQIEQLIVNDPDYLAEEQVYNQRYNVKKQD